MTHISLFCRLLFSQSLLTLDLIEDYLELVHEAYERKDKASPVSTGLTSHRPLISPVPHQKYSVY